MDQEPNIETVKKAKLLSKKNVESYFLGEKTVGGQKTGEQCLIIGVTKKQNISELSDDDLIPQEIEGIKTDVIEMPEMFAFDYCGDGNLVGTTWSSPSSSNPNGACDGHAYDKGTAFSCIPGGISIGPKGSSSAGTLGYSFLDQNNNLVGLTNNHVVGTSVYEPSLEDPIEYTVGVYNGKFTILDNAQNFYADPIFNETVLPRLEAGRKYIFKAVDALSDHPFIITSSTTGGGDDYSQAKTNVTIKNSSGDILYENGQEQSASGRTLPYLSGSETLEYVYEDATYNELYFQCAKHSGMGNKIEVLFFGTPYCFSSNQKSATSEYLNGQLDNGNIDSSGKIIESPSSLDDFLHKRHDIGSVQQSYKIKFNHPSNSYMGEQPVNRIDASIIDFNENVLPTFKLQNLKDTPTSSSSVSTGQKVFKSGRTTGVTPQNWQDSSCTILSTTWHGNVNYCPNIDSVQHKASFEDIVIYYNEGSWFSDAGDSGSVVLSSFGDQAKIIGLHFAGYTYNSDPSTESAHSGIKSFGLSCKIDNVKSLMNISDWSGKRFISTTETNVDNTLSLCGDCYKVQGSDSIKVAKVNDSFVKSTFNNTADCINTFKQPYSILTTDSDFGVNYIKIFNGDTNLFKPTDLIRINPGLENEEDIQVGSVATDGTILLTQNLTYSHKEGSFVINLG